MSKQQGTKSKASGRCSHGCFVSSTMSNKNPCRSCYCCSCQRCRYAKYYTDDSGQQYRTLIKAYGILFKVQIRGEGGKFSFFTLVLKIGSMIALLAIATIISDVIVLYVLKSRNYYRQKKYLNVANPTTGDYDIIDSPDDDKETQPINIRPSLYESQ